MITYIHVSVYIDVLLLLYYHGEKYGRYILVCHHGYVGCAVRLGLARSCGVSRANWKGREVFGNIWARESWRYSLSSHRVGGGSRALRSEY